MNTQQTNWLKIGSWICFALAFVFNGDIAIIGAILGFIHKQKTGEKAPFYANLIVIALVVLVGLVYGIMLGLAY